MTGAQKVFYITSLFLIALGSGSYWVADVPPMAWVLGIIAVFGLFALLT